MCLLGKLQAEAEAATAATRAEAATLLRYCRGVVRCCHYIRRQPLCLACTKSRMARASLREGLSIVAHLTLKVDP